MDNHPVANTMNTFKIIERLNANQMLLPALQRKFVWKDEQICNLFDSIMKGYPIGTLIFWQVQLEQAQQYSFFRFEPNYDEQLLTTPAVPQPIVINHGNGNPLFVVLDGQQRITSIYIGLQGATTRKKPYTNAYITKELYFNLKTNTYTNHPNDDENDDNDEAQTKDFVFMSNEEFENNHDQDKYWFKVKTICTLTTIPAIATFLHQNQLDTNVTIYNNIMLLWSKIIQNNIFNIYTYPSNSMDDVLEVFVRVNRGGTRLSKTDLLFSAIVAQWQEARARIDDLRQNVKTRHSIEFSTDFIMRTCLFLIDLPTKLKISSFSNSDNVNKFRDNWQSIASSIQYICHLFNRIGIQINNLPSQNSIIPIIYHHFKSHKNYISSPTSVSNIRNYIVISNIKNLLGRSQDTILSRIRNSLNTALQTSDDFPPLGSFTHDGTQMLSIDSNDIDAWLNLKKSDKETAFILNLLYPHLRYDCVKTHIDHMHALSTINRLTDIDICAMSLSSNNLTDKKNELKGIFNSIGNLQILTYDENEHKGNALLVDWINDWEERFPNQSIPYLPDTSYNLKDIITFIEARKRLMRDRLLEILNLN